MTTESDEMAAHRFSIAANGEWRMTDAERTALCFFNLCESVKSVDKMAL